MPTPVYGAVPPVAATVTLDVSPLQRMVDPTAVTLSVGGAMIVTEAIAVQLFASVTVKENVPAPRTKAPVPV